MSAVLNSHYSPFGLNMDGPWAAQYQKDEQGETVLDEEENPVVDQTKLNRYQFNGIERTTDLGLDWDLAFYRSYDPAIGRWAQIDPQAEKYYGMTPYNGMGNNPIIITDALGDTLKIQISRGDTNDSGGNAIVNDNGEVLAGNGFESVTYSPGMQLTGRGGFVDGVITALNYIYEKIGTETLNEIISSPETSTILGWTPTKKTSSNNKDYFDDNSDGQGGSYIMFHPDFGMSFHTTTDQPNFWQYWFGDWGYRSPIEALNHELEHNRTFFASPTLHLQDSRTPVKHFGSVEERAAIEAENKAARILHGNNAKIRPHHGGMFVKAKNGLFPSN